MTINTVPRMTAISTSEPSIPRLRMEPTGSRHTLLDGGWWPRSTNPVAELPGLILAIDALRGPVSRLVLAADGWDEHPRRLGVAGRVLRLGYFASQPAALLTALCDNGDRVDLLVIAPDTEPGLADAAMVLAATTGNLIPAQHLLSKAGTVRSHKLGSVPEEIWETDGRRSATTNISTRRRVPHPASPATTQK